MRRRLRCASGFGLTINRPLPQAVLTCQTKKHASAPVKVIVKTMSKLAARAKAITPRLERKASALYRDKSFLVCFEPSLTAPTPAGLPVWGPRAGLVPQAAIQ